MPWAYSWRGNCSRSGAGPLDDRANLPGILKELWNLLAKTEEPAVVGASVNPPQFEALEHIFTEATGQRIQWVGKDIDLPIEVLTESPAQTGVDRVLSLAAAFEQMQKACVVVDAGTAITVNVCNDKGQFLGGAYRSGRQDATRRHARGHSEIARGAVPRPFRAVRAKHRAGDAPWRLSWRPGHGQRADRELRDGMGFWPDIIATGGDAQALFEGWELIHAISPDLTLYGIALAYTNHQIKHET